jgi:hypothetical protein
MSTIHSSGRVRSPREASTIRSRSHPRDRLESPQSVLIHVLRQVMEPSWAPGSAAEQLLGEVQDPLVLRQARALLRIVTRRRVITAHLRAYATITLAMNRLEDDRRARLHTSSGRVGWGARP